MLEDTEAIEKMIEELLDAILNMEVTEEYWIASKEIPSTEYSGTQ